MIFEISLDFKKGGRVQKCKFYQFRDLPCESNESFPPLSK